jgi:hypothetical protein
MDIGKSFLISRLSKDAFSVKYSSKISKKIIIYTKVYQKDENIEFLPIYMTQFL